jgi:molybdenum cofactor cytidylyltransferase
MIFGRLPLAEAEGAILAHSLSAGGRKFRKGQALEAEALAALAAAGIESVTAARLEPGDVHEDAAAERLARAVATGPGLRLTRAATGRVNLVAEGPGLAQIDAAAIDALNAVDPMLTVATVAPHQRMERNGLVATVKIISYAVPGAALHRAVAAGTGAVGFRPPVLRSASLIETEVPGGPTGKGAEAIAARLERLEARLEEHLVVAHETGAIAEALARARGEVVLILTGSATSDARDVAPEGLRAAGGAVAHFGMPVDPGNLLFLGAREGRSVIGLPGCARSPALNGADWVLERLLCGVAVTGADIARMGVGGLLKEIPTRPAPRRRAG